MGTGLIRGDDRTALRVLVASSDPGFRRLAAVAITQAGHEARTLTVSIARLRRLVQTGAADVIVLDDETAVSQLQATISASDLVVGIVQVGEEGSFGVSKWGPLASLITEVENSAARAATEGHKRHLRIVS